MHIYMTRLNEYKKFFTYLETPDLLETTFKKEIPAMRCEPVLFARLDRYLIVEHLLFLNRI
jgi:hypothetical protein